jgi:hypothetical protein
MAHITAFLYAFVPEHGTYTDETKLTELHDAGGIRLEEAVALINGLATVIPRDKDRPKPLGLRGRLHAAFWAQNAQGSFVRWALVILPVAIIATVVADQLLDVSAETVAIVVTSSILTAAGLAGLSRRE